MCANCARHSAQRCETRLTPFGEIRGNPRFLRHNHSDRFTALTTPIMANNAVWGGPDKRRIAPAIQYFETAQSG
jgi:hypothetical protein